MQIEEVVRRQKPRRKVQGISAALLPFAADGSVAVASFQEHLARTDRAGLLNAVNMDTGYVNYLSDAEKGEVLRWTSEALSKDAAFVAGGYFEGVGGGAGGAFPPGKGRIVAPRGRPHLFLTPRLRRGAPPQEGRRCASEGQ